ncbi:MAG: hypothetical protein R6X27_17500 [Candidatus Desulfacyla sp.]
MGEIRSTLDIIMEKARGVQVTEEDKAAFMRREVEGKIRGILQRHLDGILDTEQLQSEMEAFGGDRQEIAAAALRRECLERMVLDGDNHGLLNVLSRVSGFDTKPVEKLLLRYREELERKRSHREALLGEHLKRQGISGSAVVPNLKADPEWTRYSAETRDRFHQELAGLY